jgi:SAM-dependent methyltransferase
VSFKDHFSGQATAYAKFRPTYPRQLFKYISTLSPDHEVALDCATGNGQAAVALAEFFKSVIAVDASAQQVGNAERHERVAYRVAPAEATGLTAQSCAAITVAQALHWLPLELFYSEVRRLLKPGGVLAVWAYNYLRITPKIDAVVMHFHDEIVGPYWPPERKLVGRGYLDLAFPFQELAVPSFHIEARWSLQHLLGYLRTWSASQRYLAANGRDPVDSIVEELKTAWGKWNAERCAIWPLTTRIGR